LIKQLTLFHPLLLSPFILHWFLVWLVWGHAIAQAVSHWLPTVAAQVRLRTACGVCGVQSGTGAGFLSEYFGFLCQSFHQFLHHHNHPGLAQ
jgi:hypothetical protein